MQAGSARRHGRWSLEPGAPGACRACSADGGYRAAVTVSGTTSRRLLPGSSFRNPSLPENRDHRCQRVV
eukprot:8537524-Alexandrium_andersonii.AAC.1